MGGNANRSDKGNERSRADEARDPARPVDETGEKEGLGPRDDAAGEGDAADGEEGEEEDSADVNEGNVGGFGAG